MSRSLLPQVVNTQCDKPLTSSFGQLVFSFAFRGQSHYGPKFCEHNVSSVLGDFCHLRNIVTISLG